ncbi:hypothetical protein GCM10027413_14800 [Conyzicola nivalis]|uniref:Uncharacterized protein n=1 Tax=Conyzicola nivalis TaxID=1477021 RepID=A0A916SGF0_9MICO|nr:hypothetical protein [Conyzicola nivalis]GGA98932.1 hypothetical protein GCM10010979_11820 [Conyzicola nivalis]
MSNHTPTGPPESDKSRKQGADDAASDTTPGDTPTERFDAADADTPTAAGPHDAAPYDADGADTPTERFDPVIDETPTDRFEAPTAPTDAATRILPAQGGATPATPYPTRAYPPAAAPPAATVRTVTSGPVPPKADPTAKKSRTLLYWLIGIGVVLLIAVIVLLVTLFSNPDDAAVAPTPTPTQSAAPSAAPAPTEEPEEEEPAPAPSPSAPPAAGPTFATFTAPTSAECEAEEGEAPLVFSWSSDNAVRAYFGVGTQNAAINPTESDLPPTATFDEVPYDCAVPSQVYTVTLEDELGALASRTVTVTR